MMLRLATADSWRSCLLFCDRNTDLMLDAEVAMTTGQHHLLSRQSSFGSMSDQHSNLRDSPDESENSAADSEDD